MTEPQLLEAMRKHWGYAGFLPHQREAMLATLDRRDGVVVLPTGGGKSLCFQVPALVGGPCVVISPLISLMQDQVAALSQCGVAAGFLNSTLTAGEAGQVMVRWRTGGLRMLYVAPERALTDSFFGLMRAAPPA